MMSLPVDIFNMVISGTLLWLWPLKPQTIGCLHHLLVRSSQSEKNLTFTGVRSYFRSHLDIKLDSTVKPQPQDSLSTMPLFFIISLTLKPSTNIIFFYKYKFLAEEKHWRWRENIKVSPFILESTPSPPVPVPASPSQDKQMQYFLHFLSKIVLWVARLSHTVIKLHDLSWFGVKYNISLPD